ncbi:MAG: hypothetical protein ACHREM_15845 [Polyangiales bacterium]
MSCFGAFVTFTALVGCSSSTPAGNASDTGIPADSSSETPIDGATTDTGAIAETGPVDSTPPATLPRILYTDIVSGPTTGGEKNQGAYLSIFGKNFGTGGLGTTTKVTIGGTEVAAYLSLGASKARPDVQQLTVQVGALGNVAAGSVLPLVVTVNGVDSDSTQTFTVNPGHLIYVDPIHGDDTTGAVDDITKPFKTVQLSATGPQVSAWGNVHAGDFVVLRGGTYSSVGFQQYFLRFILAPTGFATGTSGSVPTGVAGTGPITLMGYPGEDAFIDCDATTHPAGCLAGLDGRTYPNAGKWIVIADLRIEGGGADGPVNQEVSGDNWRVVNNELTALTGITTGSSASHLAAIGGSGLSSAWIGNHIHDIVGASNAAHCLAINGDGSYEIAFNVVHDCKNGSGLQALTDTTVGSGAINAVHIHHNTFHDLSQYGLNIADGATNGFQIYDNVIYRAAAGGLRFHSTTLNQCDVLENTLYDVDSSATATSAVILNDATLGSESLFVKNNIFFASAGARLVGGSVGVDASVGTFSNNSWFGGTDTIAFDPHAIAADPKFVSAATGDFHLAAGSPAVGAGSLDVAALVVDDYEFTARNRFAMDLGAYVLAH